ncbi:IS5 family transposase [Kitasatospora phosalacinea]|uniref:IS5 family transposase n=1 Tax=Kitasatospora phosalacinea TaxID=2065 RepID=A0A9W6QHZ3_9ACTN|nr:IS5 family transposase [Kitasatospora phosalacinea]
MLTEHTGLPLSLAISSANVHDSQALIPLADAIPPIRSRRGPRRRRPGKLHGDKAYDRRFIRTYLRRRQITARIARRGVESSTRLGRHRWVIERTVAWLNGFRRLHRRYERKGEHFAAFASIAAAVICRRRLAKCNDFTTVST